MHFHHVNLIFMEIKSRFHTLYRGLDMRRKLSKAPNQNCDIRILFVWSFLRSRSSFSSSSRSSPWATWSRRPSARTGQSWQDAAQYNSLWKRVTFTASDLTCIPSICLCVQWSTTFSTYHTTYDSLLKFGKRAGSHALYDLENVVLYWTWK